LASRIASSIALQDATAVRGALVTIEGIDGSGKSTLCAGLRAELGERIVLLREPGGVELGERIRALVKDPALSIDPIAETLLFAAARAQLVTERLAPLLDAGATIVLDRFVDSSLAYQGAGRDIGVDQVAAINRLATGGVRPDLTILLRVAPEIAAARMAGDDRMEGSGRRFFEKVATAYDDLAAAEPERFLVIDAGAPPHEVLSQALSALEDLPT
jgi:dTMP kinase